MKGLALLLLLLVSSNAADYKGVCDSNWPLKPRPHSVSVTEFGAVGDGKTLNTLAFQNAIFYLKSFVDKGGAQLYVPPGQWLTGCITLTSHLTLFLEKNAIILGSQDYQHWEIVDPLPSYGKGVENRRYLSLITGQNLTDVVITGNNGKIDGQGSVWWEKPDNRSSNYNKPHLIELISSDNIVISNLTFVNAPAWSIHPVYCSNMLVQNISVYSPRDSLNSYGIVPDSSEHVCIENSNISTVHDAIAMKSGLNEHGLAYGKPTSDIHIRRIRLQSYSGSGFAIGSEMSGGISNILAEQLYIYNSSVAIYLKTAKGRGGYIRNIFISDSFVQTVQIGIKFTGNSSSHADDSFDPTALPSVSDIMIEDLLGINITSAGVFSGIPESPFTSICLSNVSFELNSDSSSISSWICDNVVGSSRNVLPRACPAFQSSVSNATSECPILSVFSRNSIAEL